MSWVAVGTTAVSVVGGYINSKEQAKAMRSSSGSSGYDPQVQAGTNQAIQTAEQVANAPWRGIDPNQAIAGLTPNQIAAQQEAASLGEQLPGLDTTATQAFTQGNLQRYMDPYERDVLDVQKQFATRDYLENAARLSSKDVMTSAFGGDRNAIANNQLTRDYNMNLEGIQKQGLSDAFRFGVGAFNQDRSYASGEAGAIRGALSSTGATAQSTNQLMGNFRNAQFNEQRDWTKNQNAYLTQILGGVPKGSYYTGTQSAYTNPGTGGWAGALSGAAQIGLAGLSSYQSNTGMNYGMNGGSFPTAGSAEANGTMGGGISSAYAPYQTGSVGSALPQDPGALQPVAVEGGAIPVGG